VAQILICATFFEWKRKMNLLNFPTAPSKGASVPVFLNKNQIPTILANYVSQTGDNSLSNNDIKSVFVHYASITGRQTKVFKFDYSQNNPISSIVFSSSAKDAWIVEKVLLVDNDRWHRFIGSSLSDYWNLLRQWRLYYPSFNAHGLQS
jgi:hypothetical protein